MNPTINNIKSIRKAILTSISGLSTDQLNEIPEGFNNNIIWNFAHLIASQQGLCYFRAGLEMPLGSHFVSLYKPDTKPNGYVDEQEISRIKDLFTSSIEQLEEDYEKKIFNNYQAFVNRYGIELSDIEEVIEFVPVHDAIHFGYIMALKRVVLKNILPGT